MPTWSRVPLWLPTPQMTESKAWVWLDLFKTLSPLLFTPVLESTGFISRGTYMPTFPVLCVMAIQVLMFHGAFCHWNSVLLLMICSWCPWLIYCSPKQPFTFAEFHITSACLLLPSFTCHSLTTFYRCWSHTATCMVSLHIMHSHLLLIHSYW